jgi:uncharacterized membrane protein
MDNLIQINDWSGRTFLKCIIGVQLAIVVLIGLDLVAGVDIPILRELIGFVYLAFVPGMLVLRILRLHHLGIIKTLILTVALSISTLMLLGLAMNTVLPLLGLEKPISLIPITIAMAAIVLGLSLIIYGRREETHDPITVDKAELLSPATLILCIIPFFAIFGTYMVNFYDNNILLLIAIPLISTLPVIFVFKNNESHLYPLAVLAAAIFLLFHYSLISMHVAGWDIHQELYFAKEVIANAQWDYKVGSNVNSVLSIVILVPLFSLICDMDPVWVMKIIYPLLFSLVPLGLYRIYQLQTDERIAFLSCFFFMSFFTFYTEMLGLARQQIAEVFLVSLMLLMLDRTMDSKKRAILLSIFTLALTASHYGLAYIYLFLYITAWIFLSILRRPLVRKLVNSSSNNEEYELGNIGSCTIKLRYALLLMLATTVWYNSVSSSLLFDVAVSAVTQVAQGLTSTVSPGIASANNTGVGIDPVSTNIPQGLTIILEKTPLLFSITKYLHLLGQLFIAVGLLKSITYLKKSRFHTDYLAFSLSSFAMCLGALVIPHFANFIWTTRLYHIALFFLAPFCILGGVAALQPIGWIARSHGDGSKETALKLLSLFLACFLLFNSGLVFEVAKENPTSTSLNNSVDRPRYNQQEVLGARWLEEVGSNKPVYSDANRMPLLVGFFGPLGEPTLSGIGSENIPRDSYMYLGTPNCKKGYILELSGFGVANPPKDYLSTENMTRSKNRIYDNGGAQIYLT